MVPLVATDDLDAARLSLDKVSPVTVSVEGLGLEAIPTVVEKFLGFSTAKKPKLANDEETNPQIQTNVSSDRNFILKDINLDIPSGHMMAIIGGSGSGKTSLLNALAQRLSSSGIKQSGRIVYNETSDIQSITNAYVLQTDILDPHLTCRETLMFAADLRLANTTEEQRHDIVEQAILELGLKECADTLVGNTSHRGLSGGEKRRLSIGIQLLSNPSLLFLDEPTTGLDANSAYMVVKTCQDLARQGRSIIMSLHQPRSDIFFLFDSITLLSRGQLVYSGPTVSVVPYFEKLGFSLPAFTNPADFIIDLSSIDSRSEEKELETSRRVADLIEKWSHKPSSDETPIITNVDNKSLEIDQISSISHQKTFVPFFREVETLVKRSVLVSFRDPMGYSGLLLETILMGIVTGWIFYKPGDSPAGMRSTVGALYVSCSMQGYLLILYETYRLCGPDLQVFDREHNEGCSTPAGYLISRRLAKLLTEDLFVPLIFSTIMYFMAGFRTDDGAHHFFTFFSIILLIHYTTITFATFAASISREFAVASLIANLGYLLQSIACGFFVNAGHMRPYVKWTKYVAFLWYSLGAVLSNQLTGFMGNCPAPLQGEQCYPYSGKYILDQMDFPEDWIWEPIIILLCWGIGFYLLSWVFLRFKKVNVSMSKKKSSREIENDAEAQINVENELAFESLTVSLRNISLAVKHRASKKPPKLILDNISAVFQSGSINAILGPSGSGKSTLLSFMTERLHSSVGQKYIQNNGQYLFNGNVPTSKDIMELCSYVTQEDDGLLPALTVRETLYYAASLRLPSSMTSAQRWEKANDIILKMGLKDCADTVIGNELKKGISGGEKRRVSIAVQLLSNPRVIFLDEPTSGLDSFTAMSILQVLKALAEEGRTIITTIHQPRSDLFREFGSILLLAKGGRVAYNGSASNMISYFESIGHVCPPATNIADFALDVVSVNLQSAEKESVSRTRVDHLLDHWGSIEKEKSLVLLTSTDQESTGLSLSQHKRSRSSPWITTTILTRRAALNLSRSPDLLLARIMQPAGISIILALYCTPLRDGYVGVTNRIGLIQEVSALYFVGMLNNMAIYPMDRSVFYRENNDGAYGVVPFSISYLALEVVFEIFACLIFSIFVILVVGFPRNAAMFFATSFCSFVIINCGESLGIIFNTLFEHEGFALNIVSTVLSLGSVMGGLLSLDMNVFLKAINWISPLKYSLAVIANLAFTNLKISCEGQAKFPDGSCAFDSGEKVLQSYHIKVSVPHFLAALVPCVILYRVLALCVLKLNRLKIGRSKINSTLM